MNNRRSARRQVRDCECCESQDHVDEISAVEYQKLLSLIEVIHTHAVFTEIELLSQKNCWCCKIDYPKRQHDCLMLTAEEKWGLYYKKAVALVNDNRSVWDEFIEATKVLKLKCHKDALSRTFKTLREREPEITWYTLWQLHSSYSLPLATRGFKLCSDWISSHY